MTGTLCLWTFQNRFLDLAPFARTLEGTHRELSGNREWPHTDYSDPCSDHRPWSQVPCSILTPLFYPHSLALPSLPCFILIILLSRLEANVRDISLTVQRLFEANGTQYTLRKNGGIGVLRVIKIAPLGCQLWGAPSEVSISTSRRC